MSERTAKLPPYRGVLVVDCKEFNGNPSRYQRELAGRIPAVLETALNRAGLDGLWHELRVRRSTGDGYILGVEPRFLPGLVDPYLDSLQAVLAEQDRELRAVDRSLRMRLRVSVHVGPLPDEDEDTNVNGCGKPMNDTHRLVDSTPVRDELVAADPDVTFVAAIISQRVYEDVVVAGYTGMRPSEFSARRVQVKEYAEQGWLYVPRPSRLDPDVILGARKSAELPSTTAAVPPSMTFHGPIGQQNSGAVKENTQTNYFGVGSEETK